jgi:signal transduction histidine kinase
MKLQHKINLRFLVLSLIIFAAGSSIIYILLKHTLSHEVDESLRNQKKAVTIYLARHHFRDTLPEWPDNTVNMELASEPDMNERSADTLIRDEIEHELVPARMLVFSASSYGKPYKVTIIKSLIETDDLAEIIFGFMMLLFLAIIGLLFFINRWISISAWKPFYKTLSSLNTFEIGKTNNLSFENNNILEFNQLNQALQKMTRKINADFINLKEFTENASHEIQTPLAIIKTKLELVLQDKSLTDIQFRQIHTAFESTIRLSKLNEALLLLSKIENNQFLAKTNVNLTNLLKNKLEEMEDLFAMKHLEIVTDHKGSLEISINPQLAEVLVINFLSNAWKHTADGGTISISLEAGKIMISNSGEPFNIEPSRLFNRFTKHKTTSESVGLGLAIVKEICTIFDLTLYYEYASGFHSFVLSSKGNS